MAPIDCPRAPDVPAAKHKHSNTLETDESVQRDKGVSTLQTETSGQTLAMSSVETLRHVQAEYAPLMTDLTGRFSFLRALLSKFWPEMQRDPRDETQLPVESDQQWFWFTEMQFMVIFLYEVAFMEFSVSVTKPDSITLEPVADEKRN